MTNLKETSDATCPAAETTETKQKIDPDPFGKLTIWYFNTGGPVGRTWVGMPPQEVVTPDEFWEIYRGHYPNLNIDKNPDDEVRFRLVMNDLSWMFLNIDGRQKRKKLKPWTNLKKHIPVF